MAPDSESTGSLFRLAESVGRGTRRGVESLGFGATLISQSLYWLIFGRRHGQIVRSNSVFKEAMEAGVGAIPIVSVLSFAIGITLAMVSRCRLVWWYVHRQYYVGGLRGNGYEPDVLLHHGRRR